MDQGDRATRIIFQVISTGLSLLIMVGVVYLTITNTYGEYVYWGVVILGFMLNFLLAAYYLPVKRKRGLLFGAFSFALALILLDRLLEIINV